MRQRPTRWLAVAATLTLWLVPALALARPGGGDSYSGGGGHGGSGDGGGGGGSGGGGGDASGIGELIFQLIRLCIYYPKIGIPIVVIVAGFFIYTWMQKAKNKDWDSGPPVPLERSTSVESLTRVDPDFSQVLFEDFAFRLYATAHQARGRHGGLAELAPYLAPAAQTALAQRPPVGAPVTGVVVGAMRLYRVDVPDPEAIASGSETRCRIGLDFESNYTVGAPGAQRTRYAVESWLLGRSVTARTKPPSASKTFPCPNCGAPWQDVDAGRNQKCSYCGEVVDNGRFDWQVEQVVLRHERDQAPTLTTEVPERGTDLPSYLQPSFDQRWLGLLRDDPALSDASLITRLHHIYTTLNLGWTANDLTPVRGLISDGLYDYLAYWLSAYRAQGLRNVLAHMRITHQAPVKLTRDRWYDAITVRIWATGRDHVIQLADGAHVRGSARRDRRYSEYWTLIRSAARRGPPRPDTSCGHCGAPLVVSMAGACLHCGAHVTAGEFDWILSKIEQDDSYRG